MVPQGSYVARWCAGYAEVVKSLLAAFAIAFAAVALMLPAEAAYPLHGVVLGGGNGTLVARTPGATGMLPAGIYRFAFDGSPAPQAGSEIDAIVDGTRGGRLRLTDVAVTPPFVMGLPGELRVRILHTGDPLPQDRFVDQDGRIVDLRSPGKTTIVSFIYTRCPLLTVCPAVSGKFAYLQRRVDPAKTHLAVISLDPAFDSPSVLKRYGAQYDNDPTRWSLLTGESHVVNRMLHQFQIAPLEDSPGNIIHAEGLIIADPRGTIRQIIPTPDWDPNGVLAEVRSEQGLAANPFERLWLSAVAGIAAICGGESVAGVLVVVFATFLCIAISACIGIWFFWRIAHGDRSVQRKHG
jgi:cytochrome oxidase Cu insertion factor (SCO1/SenC/PrrC family)